MPDEQSIYKSIYGEYKFTSLLVQTANDVAVNHFYLDLHDAQSITLFDFDIICGSLLSLPKTSKSLSARYGEKFDLLSMIPALGPIQLRHLLSQVNYYTLPPGAEAELYKWMKKIYGRLDERSESFLTSIEGALKSTDPVAYLLNSKSQPTDIANLFQDEISDLHQLTSDAKLLDLMRQKWVQSTELLGNVKETESVVLYNVVLNTLSVERDKGQNNLMDAINAQYAVKIFNSQGRYKNQLVVPTLISGTERIATLDVSRWLITPHYELKPKLFGSILYFRLTQILARQSDGSTRQIAALAEETFKDTQTLCNSYKNALIRVKSLCPSVDDDCIKSTSEARNCLNALEHIKSEFRTKYERLFRLDAHHAVSDKVSLVNQVLTETITSKLKSGKAFEITEALASIRKMIRIDDATGEVVFWLGTPYSYVLLDNLPEGAYERAAFDVTVMHSVEPSLLHTKPCEPLDNIVSHDWEENPDFVINVHPKMVDGNAVLQVVATRKDTSGRQLLVRWCHNFHCYTIMHYSQRIPSCVSGNNLAEFTIEIKNRDGSRVEKSVKPDNLMLFFDDAIKAYPDMVQAKIIAPKCQLTVQFEALNGVEFQVALVLPDLLDEGVLAELSKLISSQMSDPMIPSQSLKNLLHSFQIKLLNLDF